MKPTPCWLFLLTFFSPILSAETVPVPTADLLPSRVASPCHAKRFLPPLHSPPNAAYCFVLLYARVIFLPGIVLFRGSSDTQTTSHRPGVFEIPLWFLPPTSCPSLSTLRRPVPMIRYVKFGFFATIAGRFLPSLYFFQDFPACPPFLHREPPCGRLFSHFCTNPYSPLLSESIG